MSIKAEEITDPEGGGGGPFNPIIPSTLLGRAKSAISDVANDLLKPFHQNGDDTLAVEGAIQQELERQANRKTGSSLLQPLAQRISDALGQFIAQNQANNHATAHEVFRLGLDKQPQMVFRLVPSEDVGKPGHLNAVEVIGHGYDVRRFRHLNLAKMTPADRKPYIDKINAAVSGLDAQENGKARTTPPPYLEWLSQLERGNGHLYLPVSPVKGRSDEFLIMHPDLAGFIRQNVSRHQELSQINRLIEQYPTPPNATNDQILREFAPITDEPPSDAEPSIPPHLTVQHAFESAHLKLATSPEANPSQAETRLQLRFAVLLEGIFPKIQRKQKSILIQQFHQFDGQRHHTIDIVAAPFVGNHTISERQYPVMLNLTYDSQNPEHYVRANPNDFKPEHLKLLKLQLPDAIKQATASQNTLLLARLQSLDQMIKEGGSSNIAERYFWIQLNKDDQPDLTLPLLDQRLAKYFADDVRHLTPEQIDFKLIHHVTRTGNHKNGNTQLVDKEVCEDAAYCAYEVGKGSAAIIRGLVADGTGGANRPDYTAQAVAVAIANDGGTNRYSLKRAALRAHTQVHKNVAKFNFGKEEAQQIRIGTGFIAFTLDPRGVLEVAGIGDLRLYVVDPKNGTVELKSPIQNPRDAKVEELMRDEKISYEAALDRADQHNLPNQPNAITSDATAPDIYTLDPIQLQPGQVAIVTSDGIIEEFSTMKNRLDALLAAARMPDPAGYLDEIAFRRHKPGKRRDDHGLVAVRYLPNSF